MKAQVAIEYIIITGIGLVFVLIAGKYLLGLYNDYSTQNRIFVAKNTVNKIGESVDLVSSQGPPSRVKIKVTIPEGVEEISFSNKTLVFKIKNKGGTTDVFYNTKSQIVGDIPKKSGQYYLSISSDDDHVNVTVV